MIKPIHIKLLLLLSLSILFGHSAFAQDIGDDVPTEQHVCVDADVTYTIFGFPGSTIQWYVDGVDLTSPLVLNNSANNVPSSSPLYQKGSFSHVWDSSYPPQANEYLLQIEEISAAPAACPTGLVDPGLKVYVHAKPLINQVNQTTSTCDGGMGTVTVSISATVPTALSLQYRLKNSGGTILQSFVTKNTTYSFLDVAQGDYTLEVLYVLTSNIAVVVKGSLQSQVINVQSLADVPPLLCFESTNLAQGKTASQSSDYSTAYASLAVDGDDDGVYDNGSVTHTESNAQAWWQVDLGAEEVVDYVDVFRRTDCCLDRLVNFYVLLSNNDLQGISLNDALNNSSVESYFVSGNPGAMKRILTLGNTARYVKIQLSGTNHLSLAEVKVMGCTSQTKSDITVSAEAGSCEKIVSWDEPVAVDNCPNVTLNSTHNSGDTFPVGTTTVTYTATDGAGLQTIQSFKVIVMDDEVPVISNCLTSSTVWSEDFDAYPNFTFQGTVGATTWNGYYSFGVYHKAAVVGDLLEMRVEESNIAEWTTNYIDISTEESVQVSFDLSSWNASAADGYIEFWARLDADLGGNYQVFQTVTGPVSNQLIKSPCFKGDKLELMVRVTKGSSVGIYYVDNVVISGLEGRNSDIGKCIYTVQGTEFNVTATDNCTLSSLIYNLTGATTGTGTNLTGVEFNKGLTTVSWIATDASSNEASCSFDIVVDDNEGPVLADLSDLDIEDCVADETLIPQRKSFTGLGLPATRYTDNCSSTFVVEYRIQLPDASFANVYGTPALNASSAADPSGFEFTEGTSTLYFRVLDDIGNISNIKTYTVKVNHKPNPGPITF